MIKASIFSSLACLYAFLILPIYMLLSYVSLPFINQSKTVTYKRRPRRSPRRVTQTFYLLFNIITSNDPNWFLSKSINIPRGYHHCRKTTAKIGTGRYFVIIHQQLRVFFRIYRALAKRYTSGDVPFQTARKRKLFAFIYLFLRLLFIALNMYLVEC